MQRDESRNRPRLALFQNWVQIGKKQAKNREYL